MPRRDTRVRVVGLTFRPGYPETVHYVAEQLDSQLLDDIRLTGTWEDLDDDESVGPAVLLVRNPENEYDANAIEVHVPILRRRQFVGHVPKDLAARWAPMMDDQAQFAEACVTAVPVTPDHIDRPGLEIRVRWHLSDCGLAMAADMGRPWSSSDCTCNDFSPEWSTS